MLELFDYFIYAQSKIACVPFAQSRKRNQKCFRAHFKGRPVTDLKTKRKNSLERLHN